MQWNANEMAALLTIALLKVKTFHFFENAQLADLPFQSGNAVTTIISTYLALCDLWKLRECSYYINWNSVDCDKTKHLWVHVVVSSDRSSYVRVCYCTSSPSPAHFLNFHTVHWFFLWFRACLVLSRKNLVKWSNFYKCYHLCPLSTRPTPAWLWNLLSCRGISPGVKPAASNCDS